MSDNDNQNKDAENTINQRYRRSKESRSYQTRDVDERPVTDFGISKFNVPEAIKEAFPDDVLGFIPYMSQGEELIDIIDDAMERDWKPITKGEDPSINKYYKTNPFSREGDASFTKKGGQILVRRSVEKHENELKFYEMQNKRQEEMRKNMVLFDEPNRNPFHRHRHN